MPNPALADSTLAHRIAVWQECGQNISEAARRLSIGRATLQHTLRIAGPLLAAGYDVREGERTPEDAWSAGHDEFERLIGDRTRKAWRTIKRPAGPGVIWHGTDFHVDDPGCARRLLDADIRAARDLGAVIAFGGDILNNWPLAGKLAKKWADQSCTKADALLRAQYVLELAQPDMLVWGNHEEMNPYLMELLHQWVPRHALTDYWTVNAVVRPARGREVRVILSHKFQKGQSWFHRMHGHLREMLEGEEADLLLDGHLHCDGVMEHSLPERGHAALAVASGGYKVADDYARRISRGGGVKLRGRAHWVVYDPDAGPDESLCTAFKSARQAEGYLNGLQNLRAA